jgi:hypothetical protein
MGETMREVLDTIIALALIAGIVYLADQKIITGQYALIGLVGVGTGFGVWKMRRGRKNG